MDSLLKLLWFENTMGRIVLKNWNKLYMSYYFRATFELDGAMGALCGRKQTDIPFRWKSTSFINVLQIQSNLGSRT